VRVAEKAGVGVLPSRGQPAVQVGSAECLVVGTASVGGLTTHTHTHTHTSRHITPQPQAYKKLISDVKDMEGLPQTALALAAQQVRPCVVCLNSFDLALLVVLRACHRQPWHSQHTSTPGSQVVD
jgi:hypothetical protein